MSESFNFFVLILALKGGKFRIWYVEWDPWKADLAVSRVKSSFWYAGDDRERVAIYASWLGLLVRLIHIWNSCSGNFI